MPFFLLSRDDDNLRLLSSTPSETRQDALAALSRLTAEPGFDAWDADVLLVDLDTAMPVLLVRPAEATVPASTEVAAVPVDEPVAEPVGVVTEAPVDFAPFEITENGSGLATAILADREPEIPAEEAEAFATYVSAAVEEEPPLAVAVMTDTFGAPMEPPYPVPDLAVELEPETVSIPAEEAVDSELEKAVVALEAIDDGPSAEPGSDTGSMVPEADFAEPEDEGNGDDLREALLRTTAAMAAEAGVPEAEASAAPIAQPAPEPVLDTWPWDVASVPESVTVPLGVMSAEQDDSAAVSDASVDVGAPLGDEGVAPASGPEVAEPPAEPDEGPVVSDFLMDLEPILSAVETVQVEVADSANDAPVWQEADDTHADVPFEVPVVAPVVDAPVVSDSVTVEDITEGEEADATPSDALGEEPLDDPVEPASVSAPVEEALPQPVEPPVTERATLDGYVCTDCVYVETCPNKDQRLPKDCGSFQWK